MILLVSQTSSYSYVWCFGDDGHTALEQAHSSCHPDHDSDANQHSDHPLEYSHTDHCGPCLDLLPSNSYAANRLRDELLSQHDQLITVPNHFQIAQLVPVDSPAIVPIPSPLTRIREQLLHHRTVVLLH